MSVLEGLCRCPRMYVGSRRFMPVLQGLSRFGGCMSVLEGLSRLYRVSVGFTGFRFPRPYFCLNRVCVFQGECVSVPHLFLFICMREEFRKDKMFERIFILKL